MGQDLHCTARHNGRTSAGKAYLETAEVIFRGDFRVVMKFTELTSIEVDGDRLRLATTGDAIDLELGSQAARWADKIRNPKTLLDKLGVKTGQRVAVIGIDDVDFREQLAKVVPDFADGVLCQDLDIIFYAADTLGELEKLADLKANINPAGSIWVVSRKGKEALVKDIDVMDAAKRIGLVDTKVASFSATHTALKFVIPVKNR